MDRLALTINSTEVQKLQVGVQGFASTVVFYFNCTGVHSLCGDQHQLVRRSALWFHQRGPCDDTWSGPSPLRVP